MGRTLPIAVFADTPEFYRHLPGDRSTELYGDVKITTLRSSPESDNRVVAQVYTRSTRQRDVMYMPGEDARFGLFQKA